MTVKYIALPSKLVHRLQAGELDANGQAPEKSISDGTGNPCRHCLNEIPKGETMLILAHRPFTGVQPYAEIGPLFLCANPCMQYIAISGLPSLYENRTVLIRGYDKNERIIYGTGKVIHAKILEDEAQQLLMRDEVAFVHVRSATNNCYQFRVER